jgi:iron-sulfur cluster assembly protein
VIEVAPRRPRPKIVTLSDAAAARVKEVMAGAAKAYLRVGVKNGGCAGMEYVMDYADAPAPFDEIVEDRDVRILVKADAVLFLLGSEIDYETTRLASRFVFRNPNQTDACGCGESVTIVAASEEA